MKPATILKHKFVEYIPDEIKPGTIYVSMSFATAVHKCCCGCGKEVVTPLSPTDWRLTYDGESISLYPSIGNWSFDCQSHYWIERSQVIWSAQWTDEEIRDGRVRDFFEKGRYYDSATSSPRRNGPPDAGKKEKSRHKKGAWQKLRSWFF